VSFAQGNTSNPAIFLAVGMGNTQQDARGDAARKTIHKLREALEKTSGTCSATTQVESFAV